MKVKIIEEKENPLLNRKEIKIEVSEFDKTPSREEIRKQAAAKLGADEKKFLLDNLKQEYGKTKATAFVKIYKTEDDLKKHEPKYKIKRNGIEEKPKEEKKEEAKEEKKEE